MLLYPDAIYTGADSSCLPMAPIKTCVTQRHNMIRKLKSKF
jgi:hypothetical protein